MNHWPYIAASYALTIGGMAGLALWSWRRMRGVEAKVSNITKPFASSEVEKPVSEGTDAGFSTSLETNGDFSARSR